MRPNPHVAPTDRFPWRGLAQPTNGKPNPLNPRKRTLGVGNARDLGEILVRPFWHVATAVEFLKGPSIVALPQIRPCHEHKQLGSRRSRRLSETRFNKQALLSIVLHSVKLPALQIGRIRSFLCRVDHARNHVIRHFIFCVNARASPRIDHIVKRLRIQLGHLSRRRLFGSD